ncbi:MAG: hypothetical protein HY877_04555 [Deltaproteobacteria bacterium]|nr:hypothetical protein [Deltaproteobacteria bacterium]
MKQRKKIKFFLVLLILAAAIGGYSVYRWKTLTAYRPPLKAGPLNIVFASPQGDDVSPVIEGITIMLDRPMVPLTTLDENAKTEIPLKIFPEIKGNFHWLGTSAFIFKPRERLPLATKFTVVIPQYLKALDGSTLSEEKSFEFFTPAPHLLKLKETFTMDPVQPGEIDVSFDQPMDQRSVEAGISLEGTDLKFRWEKDGKTVYASAADKLEFGKNYELKIAKGLRGKEGEQTTQEEQGSTIHTIGVFEMASKEENKEDEILEKPNKCINTTSPLNQKSVEESVQIVVADRATGQVIEEIKKPDLFFTDEISYASGNKKDENWKQGFCTEDISFHYYAEYRFQFSKPIKDRYGRSLSVEQLQQEVEGWRTDHAPAELNPVGVNGLEFHDQKKEAVLLMNASNLSALKISAIPVSFEKWIQNDSVSKVDFGSAKKTVLQLKGEYDKAERVKISLGELFGPEFKKQGLYAVWVEGERKPNVPASYPEELPPQFKKMVILSRTAMRMKNGLDQTLVWLTDLETTQPLQGKTVALYFSPKWDKPYQYVSQTVTNQQGIALFKTEMANPGSGRWLALYQEEGAFSFVSKDDNDGISPYQFSLNFSPLYSRDNYFAYIKTDRSLYRPGQEVHFSAVIRKAREGRYFLPENTEELKWYVNNPRGETVTEQTAKISPAGMIQGNFQLGDNTIPRGNYRLSILLPGKQQIFTKIFTIASYRKPDFKLKVETDEKEYLNSKSIEAKVQGQYFFGAPLKEAKITWDLTTQSYIFSPQNYPGYNFADYRTLYRSYNFPEGEEEIYSDYEGEELASGTEEYFSESSSQTDSNKGKETARKAGKSLREENRQYFKEQKGKSTEAGEFLIRYAPNISRYPVSQLITVGVHASETSQQEISVYADAVVHQGEFYIGIKPKAFVYQAKSPGEADLVTLDWKGKPAKNKTVSVKIIRRVWNAIKKQQPDTTFGMVYEPVDTVESVQTIQTSAEGKGLVTFTPQEGGNYWIAAEATDGKRNKIRSSADTWVGSQSLTAWNSPSKNRIDLVPDKETYAVGETANILIKSPVAGTRALLTFERGDILDYQILDLESNGEVLKIPVREDFLPNIYVGILLVKSGQTGVPYFKAGYTELKIAPEQKKVNVSLTTDKTVYHPKEKVTVVVKTTDYKNQPLPSHVILSVVDESILRLIDYHSPDMVKKFYYPRTLGVQTADNMTRFKAGDGGPSKELAKKRSRFLDTAYFNPDVVTNEQGEAVVAFELPDNLTTWVVEGLAATEDTRVGSGFTSLMATMPFFLRPALPRFLAVEDIAHPSVIVENPSSEPAGGELFIDVKGSAGLSSAGPITKNIKLKPKSDTAVPFDVIGKEEGQAVFSFQIRKDKEDVIDFVEQSLPVKDRSAPEVVANAGFTDDMQTEALTLPKEIIPQKGYIRINLQATLLGNLTKGLDALVHYPYGCAEQTASQLVANLLISDLAKENALKEKLPPQSDLEKAIQGGLAKLYNFQSWSGGFRFWPESQEEYPYLTDYILYVLAKAKQFGYAVDEKIIARGAKRFLETKRDEDPFQNYLLFAPQRAFHQWVLSELGFSPDPQAVEVLYQDFLKDKKHWQIADRAFLWMLETRSHGSEKVLKTIQHSLEADIHFTPRGVSWENYEDRFICILPCQNSILLKALIEIEPKHPLISQTVRYLAHAQKSALWETTHASSWALDALLAYVKNTHELESHFTAKADLGGISILESVFDDKTRWQSFEKTLPIQDWMEKTQPIPLTLSKRGDGRLYYEEELKYYLSPKYLPTREEGVVVHREFYALDDLKEKKPLIQFQLGQNYKSSVTVMVPAMRHQLIVEDLLPAGLEPVDSNLAGTNREALQILEEADSSEKSVEERQRIELESLYFYPWVFAHQETQDDRVFWAADHVPVGVYHFRHVVRAATPGKFQAIGAGAFEMYHPEVFGRGISRIIEIK